MCDIDLIFIDMDGVIADYYRVILQQTKSTITYDEWPNGSQDFVTHFGMEYGDVMKKVDSKFWASIPVTPWMNSLMDALDTFEKTEMAEKHILTSPPFIHHHEGITPSDVSECVKGKLEWIVENAPMFYDCGLVSFSWRKYIAASSNSLLIDDSESNVENFIHRGGHAILVPGKHNCRYGEYDALMEDPEWMLKELAMVTG